MNLNDKDLIKNLEKWKKNYITSMKALSRSKNTIELYSRVITFFIDYIYELDEDISMKDIKQMYFINFLSYVDNLAIEKKTIKNKETLSKSTKEAYIKVIRNFFTYISDNNNDDYSYERFFRKF